MNPNQPAQPPTSTPQAPAQPAPQPIVDVAPPPDSLGNPQAPPAGNPIIGEAPAADVSSNPIAGTAAPQSSAVIHEHPAAGQALDSVLQNVTNNMKAAPPPPQKPKKKFGLFRGKPKKQVPATHLAQLPTQANQPNPIQHKPPKPKKPVLAISVALLAAVGLAAAAIMAF